MAETRPLYDQSHALVIGISNYSNSLMVPIGEAEADALAISDALGEQGFRVHTLIGHEASKSRILAALTDLEATDPGDRILLYFSGHSYLVIDSAGAEQGFLSASDTDITDASTAIPLADFLGFWVRTQAKHVGFIFDAPFSATALGITHTISDAAPDKLLHWRACQAMSAGEGGRTISMVVLGALRAKGGRLGETELYTFSDLAVYTQQRMQYEWAGKYSPVFGHLAGSQGGDMVFHASEDGVRRGISMGVPAVNFASHGERTLVARRTAVFSRAAVAKMQEDALARQAAKRQGQSPSALPSWLIPVGMVLLLVFVVVVGLVMIAGR